MKRKLMLLAAPLLLLLTACGGSNPAITQVDAGGFSSYIANPGVVVLDVRTAGEFAAGHIEGAINIDVEGGQFDSGIANLDKNAEYAIYCQSGRRSMIAAEKMADAGFTKLTNMQEGINSWISAGLPVVTN
jgi:rhodanese-related sulfurtransferase